MSSGLWDITSLGLEKALEATDLRQQVIADNIANIDTPGFKSSDVSFSDQLAAAMSSGNEDALANFQPQVVTKSGSAERADGNNVDIDTEMTDLAQNQLQNQAINQLLKQRITDLRFAALDGRQGAA